MSKRKENSLMPELRFPDFSQNGEWSHMKLGEVLIKNSKKNKGLKYSLVQSVSNKYGFINQEEYFENRRIASKDTSNYYIIKKGHFAYNPSRIDIGSLAYKYDNEISVISPLYVSFSSNNDFILDTYLLNWFSSIEFISQMRDSVEGGVRNTLSYDNLTKMSITIPQLQEQQKIASCLSTLYEVIISQNKKIDTLQEYKRGLMENLFPTEGETLPKFRFSEFENDGEWVENSVKDLCRMQAGKFVSASEIFENTNNSLFPCYGGNGLRGYTKSFTHSGQHTLIGRQGALCGNVTLARNKFHATEHAIVVKPEKGIDTVWLFYAMLHLNLNQYATGQAQPGLSVENLEKVIVKKPKSETEQQKIAASLSSLDCQIREEINRLEVLKDHKKGLLQQLFPKTN